MGYFTSDDYKFCLGELDYNDSLKYFVTSGCFHFYFPVSKISLLYLDSVIEQCYLLVHKTKKSMSQYLIDMVFGFHDIFDLGSDIDVVTNKILEFSEEVFDSVKLDVLDEIVRLLDSKNFSSCLYYSDDIISYKKKTSTIPKIVIEQLNYYNKKIFNSSVKPPLLVPIQIRHSPYTSSHIP